MTLIDFECEFYNQHPGLGKGEIQGTVYNMKVLISPTLTDVVKPHVMWPNVSRYCGSKYYFKALAYHARICKKWKLRYGTKPAEPYAETIRALRYPLAHETLWLIHPDKYEAWRQQQQLRISNEEQAVHLARLMTPPIFGVEYV